VSCFLVPLPIDSSGTFLAVSGLSIVLWLWGRQRERGNVEVEEGERIHYVSNNHFWFVISFTLYLKSLRHYKTWITSEYISKLTFSSKNPIEFPP